MLSHKSIRGLHQKKLEIYFVKMKQATSFLTPSFGRSCHRDKNQVDKERKRHNFGGFFFFGCRYFV